MYDNDILSATLADYCKWQTLPRDLLTSGLTGWAKRSGGGIISSTSTDEALLEAFLQALGSSVPLEWSVCHHAAFTDSNSRQPDQNKQQQQNKKPQQQATMHGQAVGTPYGIMCFGGLELGELVELKVKSEVSWIKEHNGYMLQPDYSRVYQVRAAFCICVSLPISRRQHQQLQQQWRLWLVDSLTTANGQLDIGHNTHAVTHVVNEDVLCSSSSLIRRKHLTMLYTQPKQVASTHPGMQHALLCFHPDLQSSSSHHSRQVFTIALDSKHSSWSAKPASPALPLGLIGHSAVMYGSRVFIFGGLEMGTAVAAEPGEWAQQQVLHC